MICESLAFPGFILAQLANQNHQTLLNFSFLMPLLVAANEEIKIAHMTKKWDRTFGLVQKNKEPCIKPGAVE
jgi:hypothetical protein